MFKLNKIAALFGLKFLQIAGFNMGSTVVLVFQAPISKASSEKGNSSEFKFCVKRGERIRMGEALGKWHE